MGGPAGVAVPRGSRTLARSSQSTVRKPQADLRFPHSGFVGVAYWTETGTPPASPPPYPAAVGPAAARRRASPPDGAIANVTAPPRTATTTRPPDTGPSPDAGLAFIINPPTPLVVGLRAGWEMDQPGTLKCGDCPQPAQHWLTAAVTAGAIF